tara:strand:+ start:145 stop:333 length:189 start_codon:yes stop_codon:yes gene_type:complete
MKVGNRVTYSMYPGYDGTIIRVEQYGNTPLYVVDWDDKCPMTGHKKPTSTTASELRIINDIG